MPTTLIFKIALGSHFGLIDIHRHSIWSGTFTSSLLAGIRLFTRMLTPPDTLDVFLLTKWKFT